MVTGVANALLDQAPLIALTGALSTSAPRGTTHQKLALNSLYASVSKASFELGHGDIGLVRDALQLTTEYRPGPVHIAIPSDVAAAGLKRNGGGPGLTGPAAKRRSNARSQSLSEIDRAKKLIASARRPAIVAGLGAVHAALATPIRQLASALGAVVVTTPKGKGLMAEDHPQFGGVLEMAGDDMVVEFLKRADLIITVGLDAVELEKPWRLTAPLIDVHAAPDEQRYFSATVDLIGPTITFLQALQPTTRPGWPPGEVSDHRNALLNFLCPQRSRLQPWQPVVALRQMLPQAAIATTDVGAHKLLVGQLWQTHEPRSFFMSNGLSAMGYGLPVAASARLVHPDRPVVAFVGDGGLTMYLGELETLRRLGLDLTIVVFVDGSLELIRRSQRRQRVEEVGTAFDKPDYLAIARAFGLRGYQVETEREMRRAAARAAAEPGIHLIAANIDGADYRL